jgi:hypothetical protein
MYNKYTWGIRAALMGILIPSFVFAQPAQPNFIVQLVGLVEAVITALFPIVVTLAVLAFAFNTGKYLASKNIADQSVYKAGIINSFIGLFVIFTVFGIAKILAQSLGIPGLGEGITIADPSGLGTSGTASIRDYILLIAKFLSQRIVPVMISVGILIFFSNIAISMTKTDSDTERTNLNAYLRWGILAIFVLLALFSIVNLFTGTFFGTRAFIPQFPTS